MKKFAVAAALIAALLAAPLCGHAEEYRYMKADQLEEKIKAKEQVKILDIQVEPEYEQHHIKGAMPTYSYPVKSEEDKAKLDAAVPALKASAEPVVIVCPKGGGGAERTYMFLKDKGIDVNRLYILEKGQAGWDRPNFTETGR